MKKAVLGLVPFKPYRPVRHKLDVVNGPAGGLEFVGNVLNIIPILLHVKRPHVGEDHPLKIGLQKRLKDVLTKLVDKRTHAPSEQLDDRLDGHMVMKQPEVGYLHELLADGHLSDRAGAD